MTAVVITPSTDTAWVRPIAALRSKGIGSVVVTLDAPASDRLDRAERARLGERTVEPDAATTELQAQRARALRHALAEFELRVHQLVPGRPIGELLG
jgi:hypothetical protein